METIKNLTSLDLQKYVVKKAGKSNVTQKREIIIKLISSGRMTIYYYSEIFKKFKYIIFYTVDNMLLMELTNEQKENAYELTQKKNSVQTCIAGTAEKQLRRFCGEYRDVKFYNKTKSNPLLYITL